MKIGFKGLHPLTELFFYVLVFIFGLISSHPLSLVSGLFCAFLYDLKLRGKKAVSFFVKFIIPLCILSAVFNGFVSHFGETSLFTLPGGTPFTLESVIYGLIFALRASVTLIWLNSFNEIITNDRIVFLFGRFSPKIALIISMALRFIPLITEQSSAVNAAWKGIGTTGNSLTFTQRIKSSAKKLSVLVSWTLERGIDTSSSMKARGYGLKGRTSYNSYIFTSKDVFLIILLFIATVIFFISKNSLSATYNPVIAVPFPDIKGFLSWLYFIAVMLFPLILDFAEEKKWSISV